MKNYSEKYAYKCYIELKNLLEEEGIISKASADRRLKYMKTHGFAPSTIMNLQNAMSVYNRWKEGKLKEKSAVRFKGCDEDCFNCPYPDCLKPDNKCSTDWIPKEELA